MSLESSIVQRRLGQPLAGLEDLRPAVLGHPAPAQLLALDPGLRGDEALRELGLGHLEREQRDRAAASARPEHRVLGDVGDQRRLAHRRARGEHDQVARLKAAGHLVEVLEARRRAGQRRLRRRQAVELVGLLVEDLGDRADLLLAVVVRDLEHGALGALDQVARRGLARQHARPGSRTRWSAARASARCRARSARTRGRVRRPAPSRRARRSPPARRSPRACRAGAASRRPSGGRSSGRSRRAAIIAANTAPCCSR